jgi:hypothetical protein
MQADVLGLENHAYAAAADRRENAVVRDGLANHERSPSIPDAQNPRARQHRR